MLALRCAALVALCVAAAPLRAFAVTVSPTALYIDSRTRSGTLTLYNPGNLPEEIELRFAFGYPRSDSLGNVTVSLVDTAAAGEPSLVPWLRAFPRRLRLAPGQRQVVRILVEAPADLPPGEYWGRVTVLARGGQPPIEQQQGAISMHLDLQTLIVTAVTYRNGGVTTGVAVDAADARLDSTGARLRLDLQRTGTAAYIGHVHAEVRAPDGRVVAAADEDLAVYRALRRMIEVPFPVKLGDLAGYTVRFELSTNRPDLPPDGALASSPVTGTVPLRR